MSFDRLLKYINLLVATLLAAFLGAGYWFAWRPMPKTSGTIRAPIEQKASVARDALGVPHIRAGTLEDALFLQGFVTSQDRFWQMDALRRRAAGELAEVAGEAALESDREARRLRLWRIADEQTAQLAPAERALLAAYARGVNFYIETHRDRLPLEFSLLRYDPRPWRVADCVLAGLEMFRTLTSSWKQELQKQAMLDGGDGGDRDRVEFLYPMRAGGEVLPGSNAWVVAGARAASGKPILASDMHLYLSLPDVWYMVHLEAPGLNVAGVALPGVPGVVVGHNDAIAWGVTNLQFDVLDLYAEKLDLRSGRYVYRGHEEQARLEREKIPIKGRAPEEFTNIVTRHGPVLVAEGGRMLASRWTAAEPGKLRLPLVAINRARDWQEFRAALSSFPLGLNFVYADRDGNIGYQVTGLLPVRRNYWGDVPADGASGEFEWDGFIPFAELPSRLNPPSGMFVTANHNPFPAHYPWRVSGNFDPGYRGRQIRDLLASKPGWQAAGMLTVQKDVYSAFSHFLARQVVAAYDARGRANRGLAAPAELLRAWNGQMDKDLAAPAVVSLLFQHLRRAVAERASPGKGLIYRSGMASVAIERLLRERPKSWFDDYDRLLLRAFDEALEEGRRLQGDSVAKWRYGVFNQLKIVHPFAGRLPTVAKYFNIGPVELSGSATTVKQTSGTLGPSMRMVVDLADWDRSLLNLPAGQSGHVLSSHYKDQWKAYYVGRSYPMQYRNVQAKDVLVIEPAGRGSP